MKLNLILMALLSALNSTQPKSNEINLNSINAEQNSRIETYYKEAEQYCPIEIYNHNELTADALCNRNGKIVIEKIIGKCIDEQGNGEIIDEQSEYNYISYSGLKIYPYDIVCTYLIYNPATNGEDDIIYRCDYVIDRDE